MWSRVCVEVDGVGRLWNILRPLRIPIRQFATTDVHVVPLIIA